ncbi:MAG: hypothetical protein ABSC87_06605 [Halobacteriota archaeon]
MNSQPIESLRLRLKRRVERLSPEAFAHSGTFHFELCRLWDFISNQTILTSLLEPLAVKYPKCEEAAQWIINNLRDAAGTHFPVEIQHTAFSYFIIKGCVEGDKRTTEAAIGEIYSRGRALLPQEVFKSLFVIPLCEYLDERLDDVQVLVAILIRYKQKSEWFESERLFRRLEKDTRKAEDHLKSDLYDYLHDQGVDLTIEPYSVKGRIDLILDQKGENRVFAEAKVLRSRKERARIIEGFSQLLTYLNHFNATTGYLVIFKACKQGINFDLGHQFQSIPYWIYGNKMIFVILVDIFQYDEPVTKRGKIEALRITSEELVTEVKVGDEVDST